jgi:drug/metabolite transporter (DMT)-like permease
VGVLGRDLLPVGGGTAERSGTAAWRWLPVVMLNVSAALWGSSFFLAKQVVESYSPLSVLTFRFLLAASTMWLLRPSAFRGLPRRTWWRAAGLGCALGLAQVPHYYGLRLAPASTAGFLIGTYVVLTPLLAYVLFRRRSSLTTYGGVALALVGLAALSWRSAGFGPGEALCLVAAVLYALQIVAMSAWSTVGESWAITTIQMGTMALVVAVPASIQGIQVPARGQDWLIIGYLALVVGAGGVGIQTWSQSRLAASHAAVIMSAEPMWAATFAVLFTAEVLSGRLVVGGALLVAANVLTSLSYRGGSCPGGPA